MTPPPRKVAALGFAALTLCAAAPSALAQVRQQSSPADLPSKVMTAENAFHLALGTSDTTSIVRVLDSAAVLIQADGGRITGPTAIARALLGARRERGHYRMLIDPGETLYCLERSIQTATYAVSRMDPFGDDRCRVGIDGHELDRSGECRTTRTGHTVRERRCGSGAPQAGCPVHETRFESVYRATLRGLNDAGRGRRLARNGRSRQRPRFARLEQERGLSLFPRAYAPSGSDGLRDGRGDPAMTGLGVASMRVSPHTQITASFQPVASSIRLISYNQAQSSRLTQDIDLRQGSLELNGVWRALRVGAGPVLVLSRVHEQYENLVLHDPTSPTGSPARGTVENQTYSPRSIGAGASARLAFPISSRLFASVMGSAHVGSRLSVPGVETHRNWTFDPAGYYSGASLGFAW